MKEIPELSINEQPGRDACDGKYKHSLPLFASLPEFPADAKRRPCNPAPNDEECFALWQKYDMLDNVKQHSLLVAHIATKLAGRAYELGLPISVPETRASALLHDLAKTYCVRYGGSHAMMGAAWTVYETVNYRIAQGVMLHVHWPWKLPTDQSICSLPFFVIYADKRVRHDKCVTLEERFEDLLIRYGHTCESQAGIRNSFEQAKNIEKLLAKFLGWNLHENTFDSGRLVQ